jgi:hypothetical protein
MMTDSIGSPLPETARQSPIRGAVGIVLKSTGYRYIDMIICNLCYNLIMIFNPFPESKT